MRTYIITLTLAVVVTVATFAALDWAVESEPHPWDYAVYLWQTGLNR